ncbi:plasmid partitioning protein RepB C-terminal domain-containing protein [Microvirga pudoricolor]|uniref:plasmid partitioning protein RepB C-terminal domain-containing protein n=1 Tax=Microvirga pudoricolor TaxID=2778729 RepID=UPI00194EA431|nr:plasmid partitioning protein RepB C-terminal domain-containing protein [Microvirga pudoricolor]MBM6595339.1 ParB N-terminal domain-containing protein [Microvirga pudoricolor]
MRQEVHTAFERTIRMLPAGLILPQRQIPARVRESAKYRRIAASVAEVGIIEPLVVTRLGNDRGRYLLLDGHVRLTILMERGDADVRCLIADDDEAFTYNKRVNRLSTIQEHFMLKRALESGVPEERLAKALNVDIMAIKRRRSILDRICPEVIELLKDKAVNPTTFDVLRKMKPMRQIEVTELMCIAANWGVNYARALLAATRQEDLAKPETPKRVRGLTPEQMARMEREMMSLQQDFKQIEASYGDDMLHLVIASGYLSKLIGNSAIGVYLLKHHGEIANEFRAIIAASSLDQYQGSLA